jgi:hypothetical protein
MKCGRTIAFASLYSHAQQRPFHKILLPLRSQVYKGRCSIKSFMQVNPLNIWPMKSNQPSDEENSQQQKEASESREEKPRKIGVRGTRALRDRCLVLDTTRLRGHVPK